MELGTNETSTGMPPVDYYGACVYKYPEAGDFYIFLAQPFWHWKDRPEQDKWGYSPDPKNLDRRVIRLGPSTMDVRLGYSRDGKAFRRAVGRGACLGTGPEGRCDSRRVGGMPTPSGGGARIVWRTRAEGAAAVVIYDVAGRAVRILASAAVPEGIWASIPWDGRDDQGRPVAPGIYFFRFGARGETGGGRLAVVR